MIGTLEITMVKKKSEKVASDRLINGWALTPHTDLLPSRREDEWKTNGIEKRRSKSDWLEEEGGGPLQPPLINKNSDLFCLIDLVLIHYPTRDGRTLDIRDDETIFRDQSR